MSEIHSSIAAKDEFVIRPASRADIPIMARLSRDHIEYGLPWRWRPDTLNRCMEEEDTVVIGAFQRQGAQRLIGFCVASIRDETHLLLLAIKPRFRRKGLAGALVEWVKQSSVICGSSQMLVELRVRNTEAMALYRSIGFELKHEIAGYYEGRENAFRMALDLTPESNAPSDIEDAVEASLRRLTKASGASPNNQEE